MVIFSRGVIGQKKIEGEDVRILPTRLHPDPHPFFLPDDPPQKYHHSMQNLILRLTQPLSELTQVSERISAGYTRRTW